MPQMAPLSWLSLFLFFSLLFMLTHPLNYFLNFPSIKSPKSQTQITKLSWKW